MVKRIRKVKVKNNEKTSLQVQTRGNTLLKDCFICYNKIEVQGRVNCCNHLFCLNCIQKWAEVYYYLNINLYID